MTKLLEQYWKKEHTFGLAMQKLTRLSIIACICLFCGCSVLDRQQSPKLLDLRTDRGSEPSVGRGQEVHITIVTDDPDNDELDFRWIASGGVFAATRQDTLIDLFQDSVTVVWQAPLEPGIYELFLELGDGQSETLVTSGVRIAVTQAPPVAAVGPDRVINFHDTLRVVLDGTGSSDPDQDALMYFWTQIGGPHVGLQNSNSPSPEFQAIAPADYIFELRVADLVEGIGDTSDVVVVRVRVRDRNDRDAGLRHWTRWQ